MRIEQVLIGVDSATGGSSAAALTVYDWAGCSKLPI
jgi:hypothetical protein